MTLEFSNGSGSGDGQQGSGARKSKRSSNRHSPQQIQALEEFFEHCQHPTGKERRILGRELGLTPSQVNFWFQNKRNYLKVEIDRADNTALRVENDKLKMENHSVQLLLNKAVCFSCGGPQEERLHYLEKLRLDNAQLKEEYERLSSSLTKSTGMSVSEILSQSPGTSGESFQNKEMKGYSLDLMGVLEKDRSLIAETAALAMKEFILLWQSNEPLWMKSSTHGKYVLDCANYERRFPKAIHLQSSNIRVESSKDSCLINMDRVFLVDMFLDSSKWADFFSSIVTKARTIRVLEAGTLENRSGCLQLMFAQMHSLSPLVAPREFYFLRYCQQIEIGFWAIVDVSYDCCKETNTTGPSRCWRLPSGCMIREMFNGFSEVTWMEHVEVIEKTLPHRLYRDLVSRGSIFRAEKWLFTLQRMCERLSCPMVGVTLSHEPRGGFFPHEARRSVMKLSHRMVKSFCAILSMEGQQTFPHFSKLNSSGFRLSVRKSMVQGEPIGTIVSATTTLWLPVLPLYASDFFRDGKNRPQWDALSKGELLHDIEYISRGTHPGNCTSIIRPSRPHEDQMLILQESCIDPLGSLVVYAPIGVPSIHVAVSGDDSLKIPILPSGITVSGDGHPDMGQGGSISTNGGSLVTMLFQILMTSSPCSKQLNMDCVATVNSLISTTAQRIKVAFGCPGLD